VARLSEIAMQITWKFVAEYGYTGKSEEDISGEDARLLARYSSHLQGRGP